MHYGNTCGYDTCYNPCVQGYGYQVGGFGYNYSFILIVVLFILLIIIGASYYRD